MIKMNYKAFREMYEDKKSRLKARILACVFICMPIWLLFGAENGSSGRIAVTLILLYMVVIYGCGVIKMNTNLKQLRGIEAISILKGKFKK